MRGRGGEDAPDTCQPVSGPMWLMISTSSIYYRIRTDCMPRCNWHRRATADGGRLRRRQDSETFAVSARDLFSSCAISSSLVSDQETQRQVSNLIVTAGRLVTARVQLQAASRSPSQQAGVYLRRPKNHYTTVQATFTSETDMQWAIDAREHMFL